MFVAIVPTILTLLLFVCLSWFRNWSLKSCKKTKGIEFLNGHPSTTLNETILPFSGTTSSERPEESSEGASDVITKSSLLRILLFFVIVFLVSGCTVVVMVRNCFRTLYAFEEMVCLTLEVCRVFFYSSRKSSSVQVFCCSQNGRMKGEGIFLWSVR